MTHLFEKSRAAAVTLAVTVVGLGRASGAVRWFAMGLLAMALGPRLALAEARSCASQIGPSMAAQLVKQCTAVSPATHPPCHASNPCDLIVDEIDRSCELLGPPAKRPSFCATTTQRSEQVTGVLLSGGGVDDWRIVVLTDDGRRVQAYCDGHCTADWFVTDEDDVAKLKGSLQGRRATLTVAIEPNRSRVAGAGDDDKLAFVKALKLSGTPGQ